LPSSYIGGMDVLNSAFCRTRRLTMTSNAEEQANPTANPPAAATVQPPKATKRANVAPRKRRVAPAKPKRPPIRPNPPPVHARAARQPES